MYYDLDSIAKRMADHYNSAHKSVNVFDVAYLADCVTIMNAPDIKVIDELSLQSANVQQVLRSVYDRIVDVNSRLGIVILDDDTIRCISSSQYVAQFDGCKYWEITVHMDR